MTLVLEESEDISVELLSPILASVKNDNKVDYCFELQLAKVFIFLILLFDCQTNICWQEVLPIARGLGEKVLLNCVDKVKPYLVHAVKALDSDVNDYGEVVANICQGVDGDAEKTQVQADEIMVHDPVLKIEINCFDYRV